MFLRCRWVIEHSASKVLNIRTPLQFFFFWFYKKVNDIYNIQSKFQDTTINICFSKWRHLVSSGGNHNPVPAIFDGLPYYIPSGSPTSIFAPMTAKDVRLDYIDGVGHFFFVCVGVGWQTKKKKWLTVGSNNNTRVIHSFL